MVAVSRPVPRSLVHHADFRRLWIGDTASQLGVALGGLAVPYLAVTALGASEFQMGLLSTLTSLGFLIIGLPSGALIDRRRKRTVMMVADVGRALLLATLPLAWWLGWLTFAQVLVVATAAGMLTVFFDVSYQSYLPVFWCRGTRWWRATASCRPASRCPSSPGPGSAACSSS